MKRTAIIFGGSGYIGTKMLSVFLKQDLFSQYVIADIKPLSEFNNLQNVIFKEVDVRNPIDITFNALDQQNSWIFNFAAIHREPGHQFKEYFDTNIPGAENINNFARKTGVKNIFFTSSIAPYGKSLDESSELSPVYPETGYGISKTLAEKIHQQWLAEDNTRRLIIVRPSVIFGPNDPGNVYRMIKALKKGTFVLPNGGNVIKAYGYIFGLIDSISFTMKQPDRFILYNYAEYPLVPLNKMAEIVKTEFGYHRPTLKLSTKILASIAFVLQGFTRITGMKSDIHPTRVRKAGFPTNIDPKYLRDNGFTFKYDFKTALKDWKAKAPQEF